MLLQLSAEHGLNTDTITSWTVDKGLVVVQFSTGENMALNKDEGLLFLRHASGSHLLAAFDKLTGKETHAELYYAG